MKFCTDCGTEMEYDNPKRCDVFSSTTGSSKWNQFRVDLNPRKSLSVSSELESEDAGSCLESTSLLSSDSQWPDSVDDQEHHRSLLSSSYSNPQSKESVFSKEVNQHLIIVTQMVVDNLYWFSRTYSR